MNCCPNCFSDSFLQDHIRAVSNQTGTCSYCKTENINLIEAGELIDRFDPLINLYEKNEKGKPLNNLIEEDWSIFRIKESEIQQKLLQEISGDSNLLKRKYLPVFSKEQKNIEQWEKFREELKHNNRFFPDNAPTIDQIEPFGKYIGVNIKKGAQNFYRARKNNSDSPIELKNMGKPPEKLVLNGRANPIGIPYLYLASTIETAISELRGHKKEEFTIAEFQMKNDLELADLRNPQSTISPFELNEEDELELIYKNMPFLTLLGNELSKPIIPREANLEYLSSQYLCELLKHIGFHGIIYKSSIASGHNFVIFKDMKLEAVETFQYRITDVNYEYEQFS